MTGHARHAEALVVAAYDPGRHAAHPATRVAADVGEKKPARQTHAATDVAPATPDTELAGHATLRQPSASVRAPDDAFPTNPVPAGHT